MHEIGSGVLWIGVDAFLPRDDEMALPTRAWLAWCELWRAASTAALERSG